MILYNEQRTFLQKCLTILDLYGQDQSDVVMFGESVDAVVYEDNLIKIIKSIDDRHMIMLRKYNNYYFFYHKNGDTILFDREYIYLEDHIYKKAGDYHDQ